MGAMEISTILLFGVWNLLKSFVISASHWLGPWLAGPNDEPASTETSWDLGVHELAPGNMA
eukprot:11519920-Prorocentrum_lima.AAC.1